MSTYLEENEVCELCGSSSRDQWDEANLHTYCGSKSPADSEIIYRPSGLFAWIVNVYAVGQGYGGPEEGGWWYMTGDRIATFACDTLEEAESLRESLRERYPDTGKSYSVNGGSDFRMQITHGVPSAPFFPETRPHYE